ncbi:MAG: alcohol dehydrogenase [Microbacterium sp.]|nr:alcohol dehydrogenase [Microbacterium sp.]
MLVAEIPRFTADVLRRGSEHRALDGHAAVCCVVVPRRQEALDGQAEQHDAPVLPVEVPARNCIGRVESRDRPDLETDVLQFRPRPAQEFDRGTDCQIEAIQAAVERGERRTHDLAAAQTAMAAVPRTAPRCGRSVSGAATGHVESLGGADVCGAASPARGRTSRTLAEMDGRLCSKIGCAREAVATLTYDYGDKMAALGPLGAANDPQAHDLCSPHADRLSVPAGWLVVRHEALRA